MATMVQRPARIFLSGKRQRKESTTYRRLTTIGNSIDFLPILYFSEETLAPKHTETFKAEEDILAIFMPLVGTLRIDSTFDLAIPTPLFPEELISIFLDGGEAFSVTNPHTDKLVNYLQIWVKIDGASVKKSFHDHYPNQLNMVFEQSGLKIYFGVFDGRMEAVLPVSESSKIIAYSINGAFEAQNRLLESGDALALWELEEFEVEALSENAIMLVLETIPS